MLDHALKFINIVHSFVKTAQYCTDLARTIKKGCAYSSIEVVQILFIIAYCCTILYKHCKTFEQHTFIVVLKLFSLDRYRLLLHNIV